MGLFRRNPGKKRKSGKKQKSSGSKVATKHKTGKRKGKKKTTGSAILDIPTKRWVRFSSVLMTFSVLGLIALAYFAYDLPDIGKLNNFNKNPSIIVVTADGELLGSYGHVIGEQVTYASLPPHVINAILATEDRRFFSHWGVDPIGLARAMWANLMAGRIVQGGSTITQQVAKNVFLTAERTLRRKIQELMLAFWLEYRFSKEEIFSIYTNRVYLGAGNYGIDAASRRYFGKPAREMTVAEAAMIAGLLKAPSRYAPTNNPALARKRAEQVLINMVNAGLLNEESARLAKAELQQLEQHQAGRGKGTLYFTDWVVDQLPDYIAGADDDLVVTVTLQPKLQQIAEDSVKAILDKYGEEKHASQASVVIMRPDGAVLAMVGGRNYGKSQFNRATQALRQPGSAFKLFVYLAGLEAGFLPGTQVTDEKITIGKWSPRNYDGKYRGIMTLREAFIHSINTVAVQLSEAVGRDKVIRMAQRLGITSELQPLPSIALGATEVNLLEMTTAYAHMAARGRIVYPYAITKISNSGGRVLYNRMGSGGGIALPGGIVAMMSDMLLAVVEEGTGRRAAIGRPAAGKTGTSQDFRDAWFIGFTPQLVTGVWVGNDDSSAMKKVTGGNLPAMIWHDVMQRALSGKKAQNIPRHIEYDSNSPLPWRNQRSYPIRELKQRHNDSRHRGPDLTPSFWNKLFDGDDSPDLIPDNIGEVEYKYPQRKR